MSQFVAARPRCICRCWGARCKLCRAWVSKHDYTAEDAIACAEAEPHHVCGQDDLLAPASPKRYRQSMKERTMIPMKGGDEMTLVQPEGVPTLNRAVVSRNTAEVVGRRPEPLTGPTPQGGCRPKSAYRCGGTVGDGSCQGRPIRSPATRATPPWAAHDGPGVAP